GVDKLNTFELALINRADTGNPDNFDIEFNYGQVQWDTGSFSGGSGGLCTATTGTSARAGYANGTGLPGTHYELAGAAVCSALLGAPALASAAVIVFDFSDCSEISCPPGFLCPNTDSTKTTLTYTRSGLSITANGYNTAGGGAHLYVKQEGYGETCLGIAADVNHEINPYHVIDLNMSHLTNHVNTGGILNLESVQS